MAEKDFVTKTLRGSLDALNARLEEVQAHQATLEAELALVNAEIDELCASAEAVNGAIEERVVAKAAADAKPIEVKPVVPVVPGGALK